MPDARFSTYSGAPSLQPSLAPTMDTASHRSSSTQPYSSRRPSEQAYLTHDGVVSAEKRAPAPADTPPTATTDLYTNVTAAALGSSLTLRAATDPRAAAIKSFALHLDKMADARLDAQRYVMSGHKTEEVSKIALGAKVERALARRMTGQDAVFRPKSAPPAGAVYSEKAPEAIRAG